jgi:hypothetical protein
MPAGFDYRTELISREAEKELLGEFANLPFKPFEFHGYQGKHYAIYYGREYTLRREVPRGRSACILLFAVRDVASIPGCASTLRNRFGRSLR